MFFGVSGLMPVVGGLGFWYGGIALVAVSRDLRIRRWLGGYMDGISSGWSKLRGIR